MVSLLMFFNLVLVFLLVPVLKLAELIIDAAI